jgi:hypothetical protein
MSEVILNVTTNTVTTGSSSTGGNTGIWRDPSIYIGDPIPRWDQPYGPTIQPVVQPIIHQPWNVSYPIVKEDINFEKLNEMIEKHLNKNTIKEDIMKVFEVVVVDKKECEIILEKKVIAENTEKAMIDLELTSEIKQKVKKGEIEFIFKDLGQFERIKPKERKDD